MIEEKNIRWRGLLQNHYGKDKDWSLYKIIASEVLTDSVFLIFPQ